MHAANVNAQTDTLVVRQPEEVKVITIGDTLNISIEGSKDNSGYYYNKMVVVDSEKEEVTTTSKNIRSGLGWDFSLIEGRNSTPQLELTIRAQMYAGWTILLGRPSDMKQRCARSLECGLDLMHFVLRPRTDKWWLSLDWGCVLNQYRFKRNMMTTATDGTIVMEQYPEDSRSRNSFFRTLSSGLTLMGHYQFAKNHSVGLGVIWSSKMGDNCHYKTKYKLSDGTTVVDMNELPIRRNLFSIKAEYMFDSNIGMYIHYTPMSILKKEKGPKFSELNFGLQMRF